MNARLSLSLGGGNFGARKSIGESGVRYTSSFFLQSNDHNCQQSTIKYLGSLSPLHTCSHLDEVRNFAHRKQGTCVRGGKAGSGNTKVHLLEKGNPGKWGMENHWR